MLKKILGLGADIVTLGGEEFKIHFLGDNARGHSIQMVNIHGQACHLLEFPAHNGLGPNEAMVAEAVEKGLPVIANGGHTSNIGKVAIADQYIRPEQVQWCDTIKEARRKYNKTSSEIFDELQEGKGTAEKLAESGNAHGNMYVRHYAPKHSSDVTVHHSQKGDAESLAKGREGLG